MDRIRALGRGPFLREYLLSAARAGRREAAVVVRPRASRFRPTGAGGDACAEHHVRPAVCIPGVDPRVRAGRPVRERADDGGIQVNGAQFGHREVQSGREIAFHHELLSIERDDLALQPVAVREFQRVVALQRRGLPGALGAAEDDARDFCGGKFERRFRCRDFPVHALVRKREHRPAGELRPVAEREHVEILRLHVGLSGAREKIQFAQRRERHGNLRPGARLECECVAIAHCLPRAHLAPVAQSRQRERGREFLRLSGRGKADEDRLLAPLLRLGICKNDLALGDAIDRAVRHFSIAAEKLIALRRIVFGVLFRLLAVPRHHAHMADLERRAGHRDVRRDAECRAAFREVFGLHFRELPLGALVAVHVDERASVHAIHEHAVADACRLVARIHECVQLRVPLLVRVVLVRALSVEMRPEDLRRAELHVQRADARLDHVGAEKLEAELLHMRRVIDVKRHVHRIRHAAEIAADRPVRDAAQEAVLVVPLPVAVAPGTPSREPRRPVVNARRITVRDRGILCVLPRDLDALALGLALRRWQREQQRAVLHRERVSVKDTAIAHLQDDLWERRAGFRCARFRRGLALGKSERRDFLLDQFQVGQPLPLQLHTLLRSDAADFPGENISIAQRHGVLVVPWRFRRGAGDGHHDPVAEDHAIAGDRVAEIHDTRHGLRDILRNPEPAGDPPRHCRIGRGTELRLQLDLLAIALHGQLHILLRLRCADHLAQLRVTLRLFPLESEHAVALLQSRLLRGRVAYHTEDSHAIFLLFLRVGVIGHH